MAILMLMGVGCAGIAFLVWFFIALCTDKPDRARGLIAVKAREALSVAYPGWRVHSFNYTRSETEVRLRRPLKPSTGKASARADAKSSAQV